MTRKQMLTRLHTHYRESGNMDRAKVAIWMASGYSVQSILSVTGWSSSQFKSHVRGIAADIRALS